MCTAVCAEKNRPVVSVPVQAAGLLYRSGSVTIEALHGTRIDVAFVRYACGAHSVRLEDELRSQLQNTSVVGGGRGQECRSGAIGRAVTGRVINRAPLRMVEDVECFGAELEVHVLVHREVLEKTHIEIGAVRQSENVATGVAIGEPLRSGKGIAVVEPRSLYSSGCRSATLPWIGPTMSA